MRRTRLPIPGSPNARARLSALALVGLLALWPVQPAPAATPAASSASPILTPIAEMDDIRAELADFDRRREEWERQLDASSRAMPTLPDAKGRTVSDDLRDYVVNSAAARDRAAERERAKNAVQAGDVDGAEQSLRALVAGLLSDRDRALVIVRYWTVRPAYATNRARFDRWRSVGALRPEDVDTLEPIFELFDRQIESQDFTEAVLETYPVLERLREKIWDDRGRDILRGAGPAGPRHGAADRAALLDWRARPAPCKAREVQTSGGALPRIDVANSPPTGDYYPDDSQRFGEEGVVTLWVEVSANGCPQRAFPLVPTGYERLDQAAMKWLFEARFLPAENQGKPAAASVPLRVRFAVADR